MHVLKFCCNYVRGTCCYNYVGGSFCCNDTGDCFCCHLQLEVSAAFMQVKVFAANTWVRSFIEIMQVESAAIMQVAFSAVHYAHDYFYCNYAGDLSVCCERVQAEIKKMSISVISMIFMQNFCPNFFYLLWVYTCEPIFSELKEEGIFTVSLSAAFYTECGYVEI